MEENILLSIELNSTELKIVSGERFESYVCFRVDDNEVFR
jgi:hypothetical protein